MRVIAVVLGSLALVLSSCVVPPPAIQMTFTITSSLPVVVSNNGQSQDMGDPSGAVFTGKNSSATQMFATSIVDPTERSCHTIGVCYVPSWAEYISSDTYAPNTFGDALPTPPGWNNGDLFAPTVANYDNQYIMFFTDRPTPGSDTNYTDGYGDCQTSIFGPFCGANANCIGGANLTGSADPNGTYIVLPGFELCADDFPIGCLSSGLDESDNTGLYDPSILIYPEDDEAFLIWSVEDAAAGTSTIYDELLTSNGEALANFSTSCPSELMTFATAQGAVGGAGLGTHPFVENPTVVISSQGDFDVLASVGTYNDSGDYYTVGEACTTLISSDCQPAVEVKNEGGMSVVHSGTQPWGVWGVGIPPRVDEALEVSY